MLTEHIFDQFLPLSASFQFDKGEILLQFGIGDINGTKSFKDLLDGAQSTFHDPFCSCVVNRFQFVRI